MPKLHILNIKIVVLTLLILITFIILGIATIHNKINLLQEERYTKIAHGMHSSLRTLIDEKREALVQLSLSMAQNSDIQKALLPDANVTIQLNALSSDLRAHTSLKNIWFQILTNEGKSFYRSWSEQRGDDVTFRPEVRDMLQDPHVYVSTSVGKYDLAFKAMVPIWHDGKLLGIFETVAKLNSIVQKMQREEFDVVILVDKKFTKQIKNPFNTIFVDGYYVANVNAKENLLAIISSNNPSIYLNPSRKYFVDKKHNNFSSTTRLHDSNGALIAHLIVFYKLDKIDISDIEQIQSYLIFLFTAIFIVIIFIFYYVYSKKYETLMEQTNEELENKVQQKTRSLTYLAHYDFLTSLPNRLMFIKRLKKSIKHAKIEHKPLSLLFLDVDRFKEVNDSLGHSVGDTLLRIVASRLKSALREEDVVARLGGDEFTILIENSDFQEVERIAQKLIFLMHEPISIKENNLYITLSIGISIFPQDATSHTSLLRNADTAMYKAKELGKNRYQFYNQTMTEITRKRLELEGKLRQAHFNDTFVTYLQPQVQALTNKIVGMEALIRWPQPDGTMIPPNSFIPLAEEIGLILPLDKNSMQKTMYTLHQCTKEGFEIPKLSLNLSMKQFENGNFFEFLQETLAATGFNPKNLEFEITESQIMKDPQSAITILHKIKSLGITIAIDDFGTGYSSLSYLKKLPIDKLKIDQSFIRDIPGDEEDVAIVRSIIALAKSLNLETIAEGVETQEQKEFLLHEGCDTIQGYLYAKPLPMHEFKKLLESQNLL